MVLSNVAKIADETIEKLPEVATTVDPWRSDSKKEVPEQAKLWMRRGLAAEFSAELITRPTKSPECSEKILYAHGFFMKITKAAVDQERWMYRIGRTRNWAHP